MIGTLESVSALKLATKRYSLYLLCIFTSTSVKHHSYTSIPVFNDRSINGSAEIVALVFIANTEVERYTANFHTRKYNSLQYPTYMLKIYTIVLNTSLPQYRLIII